MKTPGRGRVVRVGLALSAAELWASWEGRGGDVETVRTSVDPCVGDSGAWPGLLTAIAEMRAAVDAGAEARVAVALLSPLVEVRRLELPPLAEVDLLRLLARNSARYFLGVRGPQVVGTLSTRGDGHRPAAVLAAAAPARVLDALDDAARAVGWTVSSVTPAEGAWTAAALTVWPALARGAAHVLVAEDTRTVLVELVDGRAEAVRLFRAGGVDAAVIADTVAGTTGGSPGDAALLGLSPSGDVRRALEAHGVRVHDSADPWRERVALPGAMAATFAGRAAGPWLRSGKSRQAQHERVRRATLLVAATAGLLFVAAAAVHLWGVEREIHTIRAERAAIHSQVSTTLVARTSVEEADRELEALADAERSAPRWAPVLADLSATLPAHVYLTAFHTRGDSLSVDGLAASASRAFDAMVGEARLIDVRAPAPVRREAQEGSAPMERFTIAAELNGGGAVVGRSLPEKVADAPGGSR